MSGPDPPMDVSGDHTGGPGRTKRNGPGMMSGERIAHMANVGSTTERLRLCDVGRLSIAMLRRARRLAVAHELPEALAVPP